MFLKIVTLCCLLGLSSAFLFGSLPAWDDLKVTWGINPFTSYNSLPRTESDAIEAGFVEINDCSATTKWRGKRYIKDADSAAILIFDKNGYIAGIQAGIDEVPTSKYPTKMLPPFIKDGDKYYLTAYFTDPDTICSTGRTKEEFELQGTGYKLLIQNGTNPDTDLITIPMKETGMDGTKWVKGGCFKTMGRHYWYDAHTDSDCATLFPIFALYNNGKLNAFGFAFEEKLASPRTEHPPEFTFRLFLSEVPKCLIDTKPKLHLSTMHIYLDKTPVLNWC